MNEELSKPRIISIDHQLSEEEIERLCKEVANAPIVLIPAEEELSKSRWIPMTEQLPEEELCFYLCYTDKGVIVECLWTNNRTGLGPLDEWGWRFMDVPSHQRITHWMSLPEPPKEEKKI